MALFSYRSAVILLGMTAVFAFLSRKQVSEFLVRRAHVSARGKNPYSNALGDKSLVLFDGVCNLCNESVNFVIDHDSRKRFAFGSIQSDEAHAVLRDFGAEHIAETMESFVLIQGDKLYTKSTAALLASAELDSPYSVMRFFLAVPRPIRDLVYSAVAKTRYRIFGKSDTCRMPSAELRTRFITSMRPDA